MLQHRQNNQRSSMLHSTKPTKLDAALRPKPLAQGEAAVTTVVAATLVRRGPPAVARREARPWDRKRVEGYYVRSGVRPGLAKHAAEELTAAAEAHGDDGDGERSGV